MFSVVLCHKLDADFTDFQLHFMPLHRFSLALHGILYRFPGFQP